MKKFIWISWIVLTLLIGGYFLNTLFLADDKQQFLIGETTHGHYQIEMACSTCHTEPFGGQDILQNACTNCHAAELEEAHDSHPKKKFTDPRNANRLENIDARYCVSCHTEHHKDRTLAMGLTLPDDYCFYCHQEVGEDRPSHKDLAYDSCASAGCHNFHDNRALYEDFLVKNAGQPWLLDIASIRRANAAKLATHAKVERPDFAPKMEQFPDQTAHWQASSHAAAEVNCGGCHFTMETPEQWLEKPGLDQCRTCHSKEADGFTSGKHGMRLAKAVKGYDAAISPKESTLMFQTDALEVQHGCNTCHNAHTFDTQKAAVDSCLFCHADEHSIAYLNSPHGKLWQKFTDDGSVAYEEVVTCATCHMPRIEELVNGKPLIHVQHNQNDNLRPNEKMIRPVCMNCHGLGFAIDALADPNLIKNNFNGKSGIHIESIDWSVKRDQQ